jgi:hypothetical protein
VNVTGTPTSVASRIWKISYVEYREELIVTRMKQWNEWNDGDGTKNLCEIGIMVGGILVADIHRRIWPWNNESESNVRFTSTTLASMIWKRSSVGYRWKLIVNKGMKSGDGTKNCEIGTTVGGIVDIRRRRRLLDHSIHERQ